MSRLVTLLVLLSLVSSAGAQSIQSQLEALGLGVYTYETITCGAVSGGLSAAKVGDTAVLAVFIQPKNGNIVVSRAPGQTPTSTFGEDVDQKDTLILSVSEATNFLCIREGTTDVTVRVIYAAQKGTPGIP